MVHTIDYAMVLMAIEQRLKRAQNEMTQLDIESHSHLHHCVPSDSMYEATAESYGKLKEEKMDQFVKDIKEILDDV